MSLVRGDVHWATFAEREPPGREIAKHRPSVILSLTGVNVYRLTVVVVPLTTSPRLREPLEIALPSAGRESKAVCDQKRRIGDKIGSLTGHELRRLEESVRQVLGL